MLMLHFQIHNIFSCAMFRSFAQKEKMCGLKTAQVFPLRYYFIAWWISVLRKFPHLNGTHISAKMHV